MHEKVWSLLNYIAGCTDSVPLYVSGSAVRSEYMNCGRLYEDVTLSAEGVDLCLSVENWLMDNGYLYTVREVVEDIVLYIVDGFTVTINRKPVKVDRYKYVYAPCFYILKPEFVLSNLAHQATFGNFALYTIDDMYWILKNISVEFGDFNSIYHTLHTFDTKILQQLDETQWNWLSKVVQGHGYEVKELMNAFMSAFRLDHASPYLMWDPNMQVWVE